MSCRAVDRKRVPLTCRCRIWNNNGSIQPLDWVCTSSRSGVRRLWATSEWIAADVRTGRLRRYAQSLSPSRQLLGAYQMTTAPTT